MCVLEIQKEEGKVNLESESRRHIISQQLPNSYGFLFCVCRVKYIRSRSLKEKFEHTSSIDRPSVFIMMMLVRKDAFDDDDDIIYSRPKVINFLKSRSFPRVSD